MFVKQILLFVKETLLTDLKAEDLEKPIQQITKSICHAKGISEQQMFENVLCHEIQSHMDGVLLPLITAIELSAIQYKETIPLITVQEKVEAPEQEELQSVKDSISVEEEKAVSIGFPQKFQSNSQISTFSVRKDKAVNSSTPINAKEPKVVINTFEPQVHSCFFLKYLLLDRESMNMIVPF